MRVLFLSGYYPPRARGGGEISTALIAQALRQRGCDVEVLTEGERYEKRMLDGVPVHHVPLPLTAKPLLERRYSRKLARSLQEVLLDLGEYDIVHAHDFRTALALAEIGAISRTQRVITHRDYAAICGTTNAVLMNGERCTCSWRDTWRTQRIQEASWVRKPFRFWQYQYNLAFRRQALGGYSHHVFISQAQRHEITQKLDLGKAPVQVIYNPVPQQYLNTPSRPGTAGNVLYAGRIEHYKGVELLLEAWREVVGRHPHAKLRLIGEGAQRKLYERLVERWELQYRVQFTGHMPWSRLSQRYDEADIVVSPHLWIEPFGRTVAEALARGKIVVAADRGGPSEMIQDGKSGLLFAYGSVSALAERLNEALSLPELTRRQMSAAARTWTRTHLAPAVIAQQYENYYMEMLLPSGA